jgi:outer membrane cobalamin receptor
LLRLKLSASYLNAQRIEEGQNVGQIPFRSNLTGQAELTLFRADPWPGVSRVSLGVLGDYRGRRFADPANLVEIPAQATMDLLAQGQFNRQVDLRLRIENLTNAARFDALGYPLPGRGCYLSAELRF